MNTVTNYHELAVSHLVLTEGLTQLFLLGTLFRVPEPSQPFQHTSLAVLVVNHSPCVSRREREGGGGIEEEKSNLLQSLYMLDEPRGFPLTSRGPVAV